MPISPGRGPGGQRRGPRSPTGEQPPCPPCFTVSVLPWTPRPPNGPGLQEGRGWPGPPTQTLTVQSLQRPPWQPSLHAEAEEKGAVRCGVHRAAGERRPGQWGQEPPTVRTGPGGHGGQGSGESRGTPGKQQVLPTVQGTASRAGPSGTCGATPQPGPREVVSSHRAVPIRSLDIHFLILAGRLPAAGGSADPPLPPDNISRNIALQHGEYLAPNAPG